MKAQIKWSRWMNEKLKSFAKLPLFAWSAQLSAGLNTSSTET